MLNKIKIYYFLLNIFLCDLNKCIYQVIKIYNGYITALKIPIQNVY